MPLQLPTLDDRSFEQLLAEAKRRIPVHTPEWTNFEGESDPGITLVQLFSFITEALVYRANRVPELNRLKFLQLLGVPLRPAAAALGLVTVRPDRGPAEAVPLEPGVVLTAGNVRFLTTDGLDVLPIEGQAFYKRAIPPSDPNYAKYAAKYAAVQAAIASAAEAEAGDDAADEPFPDLDFYETLPVPLPTPGDPNPVLDLAADAVGRSVYLALLAPTGMTPPEVRDAIGGKTLSIGVVPALEGAIVPPLLPKAKRTAAAANDPGLVFEIPDVKGTKGNDARYTALPVLGGADVLNDVGVVQLTLPEPPAELTTWEFAEPLDEGTGDFPPRLEDEALAGRLVTWVRVRLPELPQTAPAGGNAPAATTAGTLTARLTWLGVNAARVVQAVPVADEPLGTGTGEPDQTATLANTPVLPDTVRLQAQDDNGIWQNWRLVDDLLAAGMNDPVFAVDPESGVVRFGDGLRGLRPGPGGRIRASYRFGGGRQGNVAPGAIKTSPDPRLQGAFQIANPVPAWGGTDGESVADGERRVPLYVRHRDRLVTEQDFIDVTERTEGADVGRVDVLPLYRPPTIAVPNPPAEVPGVVTVLVVPKTDPRRPLWPTPDRLFLRRVCDYLDSRRLVTTELYVRGPEYVPIYLSVGVEVLPGFFRDAVFKDVIDRLNTFLSALPPGGPAGEGWPLNKRLLAKELEAVVDRVAGVDFADAVLIGFGDDPTTPRDEVPLANLQLPFVARVNVAAGQPLPLDGGPGGPPPATVPVPVTRSKC